MNDRPIDEILRASEAKHAEGSLPPDERKQLGERTDSERIGQRAERMLQRTVVELGPVDRERVEKARAKTWAMIEERMARREKTLNLYRRIVRIAASAAAVLIVGVAALLLRSPAEMLVVVNEGSEVSELLLPDSSRVWLQLGAKITYPAKFSRNRRPVTLAGEAFFDVARDPSRPFTVRTTAAEVEVLGTRFDVNAPAEGSVTEVALESGSVALRLSGKEDEAVKIRPGELAVANLGDATIAVTPTDPYLYSVWKEKELVFRARPLGDILKVLEKAYGVDIRLENEALGRTLYTGRFKRSLPLEEVLAIIRMNTSMEYGFRDDGSIQIR